MADVPAEFFGAPPQQAMQRLGAALWPLVSANPRFAYEGRFVAIDAPDVADLDAMGSLVALQGGTGAFFVDAAKEAALLAGLKARGLTTDRWDHLMADASAVPVCRALVENYRVPEGFVLRELGADTPQAEMAAFAAMAMDCGVNAPAGRVFRGGRPSVLFVIADAAGDIIACSGAVARHEAGSPFADASWWGMLATRPDVRGRGFSRYLGALALLAMADRHGKRRYYTGVRPDNAVSQKLCRSLGLGDHGLAVIAALDPARFGDVRLTR